MYVDIYLLLFCNDKLVSGLGVVVLVVEVIGGPHKFVSDCRLRKGGVGFSGCTVS